MSIASVVTRGFFGNIIPVRGYVSGAPVAAITGGHFLPAKHKNRRTLSNVNVIYKAAQSLSRKETKALRDAISEFVAPEVAMIAEVPDIAKVDYAAIEANDAAYEKFAKALESIEQNIKIHMERQKEKEQEDDDLMTISIISLLIH